jgi:uncharacterized protein YaiI (UPF0178 family)
MLHWVDNLLGECDDMMGLTAAQVNSYCPLILHQKSDMIQVEGIVWRRHLMKVLIDADGCPVVKVATAKAKELNIEVVIVCDSSHHFESEYAKVVTVVKGRDAVDFELLKYVEKNDIVITQDYGLASLVLAKGGRALNQNGLIYTEANINQLLYARHEHAKIRKSGGRTKGPRKRNEKDNQNFLQAFMTLLKEDFLQ